MDNNYVINRVIDILNSQNSNLLVGNISSPRPGSICQVSTNYGIKSAYNINCTYPGKAVVVWDKDEKQYYVFTTTPSETISSRQLSYRKNREVKVSKEPNLVKILYQSTIGTTVRIYVGGCYKKPKLLYTYDTNGNTTADDLRIDATGKKPDDWIVGYKELNKPVVPNVSTGKFKVHNGSTAPTYTSSDVYVAGASNKGKGFFEANYLDIFLSTTNTSSFSTIYETYTITQTANGYNASTIINLPNFKNGELIFTTMSGVAIRQGDTYNGILSILGIITGMYSGNGTAVTIDNDNKLIRSILPGNFGTVDGIPINMETYQTVLIGNKNQYIYNYKYNHNVSIFSTQVPLLTYISTVTYGVKPFYLSNLVASNSTNWIDKNFYVCNLSSNLIVGNGLKDTLVINYELQSDAGLIRKDSIKAKYYAIPKANNETITFLNASYYSN